MTHHYYRHTRIN